jgi:hypothetical protein
MKFHEVIKYFMKFNETRVDEISWNNFIKVKVSWNFTELNAISWIFDRIVLMKKKIIKFHEIFHMKSLHGMIFATDVAQLSAWVFHHVCSQTMQKYSLQVIVNQPQWCSKKTSIDCWLGLISGCYVSIRSLWVVGSNPSSGSQFLFIKSKYDIFLSDCL